jgi:hypothetical protein
LKIRPDIRPAPDIRYPAFRLAGYPAKSVSGASLIKIKRYIITKKEWAFCRLCTGTLYSVQTTESREIDKYYSERKKS